MDLRNKNRKYQKFPSTHQNEQRIISSDLGKLPPMDIKLEVAVLGAMMKPKQEIKKGWIIWIIIAAVAALMAFIFLKKPEPAAAAEAATTEEKMET